MSHSPSFIVGVLAAWYVACGLIIVAITSAPGALLDRETGRPKSLTPATRVVVALLWPWFFVAWTLNTWVRR